MFSTIEAQIARILFPTYIFHNPGYFAKSPNRELSQHAAPDSDKNPLWENDRFGRLLHLTGKSMYLCILGFQPLIFSS